MLSCIHLPGVSVWQRREVARVLGVAALGKESSNAAPNARSLSFSHLSTVDSARAGPIYVVTTHPTKSLAMDAMWLS